jgi:hypothetical protein
MTRSRDWKSGAILAAPAAHEGHGRAEWQSSVIHYLLEPEHAVPALIVLACVIAGAAWFWRRARRGAKPPALR